MNWRRISTIALVLLIPMMLLMAQAGRGNGPLRYDPKTETAVKGTVEEVKQYSTQGGAGGGTHLNLKTDSGNFDVHVGPSAYLSKKGFMFTKGDEIEVTGSKLSLGGTDSILAREIKKDGKTLTLRDAHGIPAWSRRGQGTK